MELTQSSNEATYFGSKDRSTKRKKRIISIALVVIVVAIVVAVLAVVLTKKKKEATVVIPRDQRIPCPLPRKVQTTEDTCLQYSCLWDSSSSDTPPCFTPLGQYGYVVVAAHNESEDNEQSYLLSYKSSTKSPFDENVIQNATFTFTYLMANTVRFKLTDTMNSRYEVPVQADFPLLTKSSATVPETERKCTLKVTDSPDDLFSFQITRNDDEKTVLFDSTIGNIILTDRFLQLSTKLPSKNVYGLGENSHEHLRHNFTYETWPLFSRDQSPGDGHLNLYGVHPFYVCVEASGRAHGLLLLNSNAMEYTTLPAPGISFNAIGGVLDFFLFVGDSPEHVVKLYHQLIGRPTMPPYWALGFHLSRYGYNSLESLMTAEERTINAGIPLDVQHLDIDYMTTRMDFTYDEQNFQGLPDFIRERKAQGMKFITIIDPAVILNASAGPSPYPKTYRDGIEERVFVEWDPELSLNGSLNPEGFEKVQAMVGQVWPPGPVAFPDFFKSVTSDWWKSQLQYLHDENNITFDGIWIDMNEPSDFSNVLSIPTLCGDERLNSSCWSLQCPQSVYDYPEYPTLAAVWTDTDFLLRYHTLCMSAIQGDDGQYRHYDVHSLYGHTEGVATKGAVEQITGKRSLVISRSTYVSSGRYISHWLGDNYSRWKDLHRSIIGMLEFNMFGIPFIGADICGFNDNTTEELCIRWFQLGSFYPFCRNHNDMHSTDQDPGAFSQTAQAAIRVAIKTRYRLLPYLYTLFYRVNIEGGTVARPLYHEFFEDKNTLDIDTQFMWGSALLISPFLFQNQHKITYYVPQGVWYNYYNCTQFISEGKNVKMDYIDVATPTPLLCRGGYIIPTQEVQNNTQERLSKPLDLYVYPKDGLAEGELFWDDGESIDSIASKNYGLYQFSLKECELNISASSANSYPVKIQHVVICSQFQPNTLVIDGIPQDEASINANVTMLILTVNLNLGNSSETSHVIQFHRNSTCDL